jgi:alginate O-acetyltransferase complex protein AlgI
VQLRQRLRRADPRLPLVISDAPRHNSAALAREKEGTAVRASQATQSVAKQRAAIIAGSYRESERVSFNSLQFLAFITCVLAMYYSLQLTGRFRLQNYLIIAASYVFYSAWDWRFTLLLIWITIVDYNCALAIDRSSGRRRTLFLIASITSNLCLLGFFKYFGFFEGSLVGLLKSAGVALDWPALAIILPIGISFVVFKSMSYTIDVYRGELRADSRFSSYAFFVAFFPKLVAGPIIRAKTLLRQIERPREITGAGIERALWWIAIGYLLKLVIADNLSADVDRIFSSAVPASGGEALLGIYGFAMQIFGDFAGYSSIAIGIAGLLGFSLPRNFRQPYLVTNPQEFWRNWHISLSSWLRDYLYISLGGSRTTNAKTNRNIMITMTLGGLWHGASWTYVIWGIYHGILLVGHRVLSRLRGDPGVAGRHAAPAPQRGSRPTAPLAVLAMFQLTCIGWLLFRAHSLAQVRGFLAKIVTDPAVHSAAGRDLLVRVGAAAAVVLVYQLAQRKLGEDFPIDRWARMPRAFAFAACYFAVLMVGEFGIKGFIYFQF